MKIYNKNVALFLFLKGVQIKIDKNIYFATITQDKFDILIKEYQKAKKTLKL